MNPESISEYIQSLLNKIEDLESINNGYRYDNEKLTTELAKAKEDIETLKAHKKILSSVNPTLGNLAFAHCPW